MTAQTVVVLGAGYLGAAAAQAFAARGDTVYSVRRHPTPVGVGILALLGDAGAPDAIRGLPRNVDHVVLTVAPAAGTDSYEQTYVRSAAGAVALARRCGARSLVYTSSTGVYGVTDGTWVSESSEVNARDADSDALIRAEKSLLDAGDIGVTVLRVAGIYGPGRNPVPRYSRPEDLPARGEYYVNLAHRDDIVSAVVLCAETPASPRVFNCSDGQPARALDVARWTCEFVARPWPEPIVFSDPDAAPRSNQRIRSDALRAHSWSPAYPSFREGFRALGKT